MPIKRPPSPPPPAWGRGLHAFAERVGESILAGALGLGTLARRGLIALPPVRRRARSVARLAIRSARGHHGSLAMLGVWCITGIALLSLLLYALASRTPSWFRTMQPRDPALIDLAQRLENRVITQVYKFRGEVDPATLATGQAWSLVITQDEATAWLTCKLPEWLRNLEESARWPAEISSVQTRFDASRIWVAAAFDCGTRSVVSFGATPRMHAGGIRLASPRASIGSLTLPAAWLGGTARGLVENAAGPWRSHAWAIATGSLPLITEPVIRLEDGRQVRIIAIEHARGVVTLRCQTEVRPR